MPGKFADTYELSAGLHDDTNVKVEFATFRTDPQYNNGKTLLLVLAMTPDDGTDTFEHMLSIGGDWQTPDGGFTVQHPSSAQRKFNKTSNYGKWLTACEALPALWDVITDRGPATDARVWEGLRFHVSVHEEERTFNGETTTRPVMLPDVFLGVEGASVVGQRPQPQQLTQQPATATPAMTPQERIAAARAAAASKPAQQSNLGLADEQHAQLVTLAQSSSDHQDFLIKALDLDWVIADDELMTTLGDPDSFYASHRS